MESERVSKALDYARQYGGIEGDHHKAWVIDQMVRALTGCPEVSKEAAGYSYKAQGESQEYAKFLADTKAGNDGPDTYGWEVGIPP